MFEGYLAAGLSDVATPVSGASAARPDAWIRGETVPEGAPQPTSDAFTRVDAVLADLAAGKVKPKKLATDGFTPHQWLHFLRGVPSTVGPKTLAKLDAAFSLTASGNYEILAQWLELSILRKYTAVDQRLEEFLGTVGRRKFLMPLYEALLAADRRDDALRIYKGARAGYHPITQHSLDQLLTP